MTTRMLLAALVLLLCTACGTRSLTSPEMDARRDNGGVIGAGFDMPSPPPPPPGG